MHISSETNSEASSLGKNKIIFFEIKEDGNGKQININMTDHNNHVLIWMTRNRTDITACNFKICSAETEYIQSDPNTAYMICAAEWISTSEVIISTLNCRAITTQPFPLYRAWLENRDRVTLLLILCAALLVSVIVGATTIYCVLLHVPELINDKKKRADVVILREDGVIIMPKG
jgi:hypothetical protein